MESSGTRPINKRTTMLAARSLLALFVAYGSIFEMTRETAFTTLTRLDPGVPSAVSPGITYTLVRLKTALRGWPITFYVKTGLPERLSPWAGNPSSRAALRPHRARRTDRCRMELARHMAASVLLGGPVRSHNICCLDDVFPPCCMAPELRAMAAPVLRTFADCR